MTGGTMCSPTYFWCDGRCQPRSYVKECDGRPDCQDGTDELYCSGHLQQENYYSHFTNNPSRQIPEHLRNPGTEVVVQTIIPTIVGCILLVAAMLYGIKKCKQWELDRIMQMRRTRRVVQRITDHLRQKNLETLQTMRAIRLRRAALAKQARLQVERDVGSASVITEQPSTEQATGQSVIRLSFSSQKSTKPPPVYDSFTPREATAREITPGIELLPSPVEAALNITTGNSPPPPYEEALVDEYFEQLFERAEREMNMPEFAWTYEGLRRNAARASNSRRASRASTVQSLHNHGARAPRRTSSRMSGTSRRSSNFSVATHTDISGQTASIRERGSRSARTSHDMQMRNLHRRNDSNPNTVR